MKTLITVALLTLAGTAHAGTYDHAACEMVLEDYRLFRNPADRTADATNVGLTAETLKLRDRRTETYIRNLGGWDLLDAYTGVSLETMNWLDENRTSIAATPDKAARDETNAYILSLCE
jgi:hypothetical protein